MISALFATDFGHTLADRIVYVYATEHIISSGQARWLVCCSSVLQQNANNAGAEATATAEINLNRMRSVRCAAVMLSD